MTHEATPRDPTVSTRTTTRAEWMRREALRVRRRTKRRLLLFFLLIIPTLLQRLALGPNDNHAHHPAPQPPNERPFCPAAAYVAGVVVIPEIKAIASTSPSALQNLCDASN